MEINYRTYFIMANFSLLKTKCLGILKETEIVGETGCETQGKFRKAFKTSYKFCTWNIG